MAYTPPYDGLPVAVVTGGPYNPIKVRDAGVSPEATPVFVVEPGTVGPYAFLPIEIDVDEGIPVFFIGGAPGSGADPEVAPEGFVFVVDGDGAYLTDIDGHYLVTPE